MFDPLSKPAKLLYVSTVIKWGLLREGLFELMMDNRYRNILDIVWLIADTILSFSFDLSGKIIY